MDRNKLIPADEFCAIHNIEFSFIQSLEETGLIEIQTIEQSGFIPVSQVPDLEKMIRLYSELDINIEGIDTILHLLHRIEDLQEEVRRLKNRLYMFESEAFD